MRKQSNKILILGVVCLAFLFILPSLFGCATKEVTKVEMVVLSGVAFFELDPSGIKGPAIFGDFSLTHKIFVTYYGEGMAMIEFIPPEELGMIFILFVKTQCPEAIVLQAYNMKAETTTWWVYDCEGQAREVTEKQYDDFLEQDNPCCKEFKHSPPEEKDKPVSMETRI